MLPDSWAALAIEAGQAAHLADVLPAAARDADDLERLRDPGTAVASAATLALAWADAVSRRT
jgi:hypothetical protein